MNSVLTPVACARATIAGMLPPLDWFRYQIHMPWPSKPVPPGAGGSTGLGAGGAFRTGAWSAWWTTRIGPKEPVLRVLLISTMMRPECAPLGTVTIRPRADLRRRDPGELRLTRAPKARGKPTTIPAVSPLPLISRVPLIETWWGLLLQCAAGTQLTLETRTGGASGSEPPVLPLAPVAPVPLEPSEVAPAAGVPPGLAALAGGAMSGKRQSDSAATAAARGFEGLWA